MIGLIQDVPLQISGIMSHASRHHGGREVVSRLIGGGMVRSCYAQLEQRALAAAGMLQDLGVQSGDRVATLAWNGHRHLELFFAVPGIGAILHTVNPRLFDEQIIYTLNHAGSRVLLFDANLRSLVERLRPHLTAVEHFLVLADETDADAEVPSYEVELRNAVALDTWPTFDERLGAVLCYTSGTTGNPKGVLYSHRSIVLHAMSTSAPTVFDVAAADVMLPCASMFHATAWGWPYVAAMQGAKLVLPGDRLDPSSLAELIRTEEVTITGGVPTIWTGLLRYIDEEEIELPSLRLLFVGGSAVPPSLEEGFRTRHGVELRQLWGMTETGPIGSVSSPSPALEGLSANARCEALARSQGRALFGMDFDVLDDAGNPVPQDGTTPGRLVVRGPWVVSGYFGQANDKVLDPNGWFDTGDIATLDAHGYLRLTDRAKDLIKSGGEWISSIDLENAAMAHPAVKCAAVIGVYHPKWEERPLLLLETIGDVVLGTAEMHAFLADKVARWWLPDAVLCIDTIPLTATGKIDKKALRDLYRDYLTEPVAHRTAHLLT